MYTKPQTECSDWILNYYSKEQIFELNENNSSFKKVYLVCVIIYLIFLF